MAQKKVYDKEFKIQAVKLRREIGFSKAEKELGINTDTLYDWNKRAKDARWDLEPGTHTKYCDEPYRGSAETQTAKQRTSKTTLRKLPETTRNRKSFLSVILQQRSRS